MRSHTRPSSPTRRPGLLLTVVGIGLAAAVSADQAQQPIFRSLSQTVPIYATAVGKDGRLVTDLEQKDFEVYDNGKLQALTVFKTDVQPITVVVMLDTSGSMTLNLERVKLAAERFVLRLLPDDRARIGSFSDRITISPRFTSDRDELVRVLHEDIRFGNPTFLWDAINASMNGLAGETGRRVVLIFTDGKDETSQITGSKGVIARAQTEDFMVYGIGLRSQILGRITQPDGALRRLTDETGGGYFELKESDDLNATFTRVADELHRQYVLGFSVTNLDGLIHKLDVKTKVPGVTIRARKSYLSAPAAPSEGAPAPSPR